MSDAASAVNLDNSKLKSDDPRLKHEFVGMMFALTIGEIGLQVAALVQAGSWTRFLPAYSHLFVATVLVAASWVGWSRSPSPGAKADVEAVFQWEFVVLLVDVFLVICYFIVVRTVDFNNEKQRIDPSSKLAFWLLVIFGVYLFWDIVTKIVILAWRRSRSRRAKGLTKGPSDSLSLKSWCQKHGIRIIPTIICFGVADTLWRLLAGIALRQMIAADFALLSLVLLFRALKDLASSAFESSSHPEKTFLSRAWFPLLCSAICIAGIVLGLVGTRVRWSWYERVTSQVEILNNDSVIPEFHRF